MNSKQSYSESGSGLPHIYDLVSYDLVGLMWMCTWMGKDWHNLSAYSVFFLFKIPKQTNSGSFPALLMAYVEEHSRCQRYPYLMQLKIHLKDVSF